MYVTQDGSKVEDPPSPLNNESFCTLNINIKVVLKKLNNTTQQHKYF